MIDHCSHSLCSSFAFISLFFSLQHMREAAERRQQLELEHEQALAVLSAKQQEIELLQKVRGQGSCPHHLMHRPKVTTAFWDRGSQKADVRWQATLGQQETSLTTFNWIEMFFLLLKVSHVSHVGVIYCTGFIFKI